jgi:hypothetical protein
MCISSNLEFEVVPWIFTPLPVGSIQPRGWLLGEMQTMANGLAGHKHDFYHIVKDSRWLFSSGGTDYSNLNEALPYWFNGMVPLAYSLDDQRLKSQIHFVAETVLGLQSKDGWIGPEVLSERNFWARAPFFLGLTQLVEANSTSWERPVVEGLRKFMKLTNSMLRNDSLGFTRCASGIDCRWGQTRVHDLIITIQWMLENYPSHKQDRILWENMEMFYNQTSFKWDAWYNPTTYPQVVSNPTPWSPSFPYLHGVSVGQGKSFSDFTIHNYVQLLTIYSGLKASAVIRRFNHNESLVEASMNAVNWTFLYHGAPSGSILADEIERDLSPYMGSELCTAVETGYSLAYLYQALGTNYYADRAERVIFNALPVMLTGDMWAHQYMDQPNAPWTNNTGDMGNSYGRPVFTTDGDLRKSYGPPVFTTADIGVATVFGMEPQYPCCTVNYPQGYPKFLTHSWATIGKSGIAHTLLSPSIITTTISGHQVSVECNTAYPFDNTLTYLVQADTRFDLYIRVPSWYIPQQSSITINGTRTSSPLSPDISTGVHKISLPAGISTILYTLGAGVRIEPRANNSVSVYVGNMLYALDVGMANTSSLAHPFYDPRGPGLTDLPFPQLRDYYMTNTSAWNVAIDPATLKYHEIGNPSSMGTLSFSYGSPPNYITVKGCEIEWGLYLGATPDVVPSKPKCLTKKKTYRLIPYGSAKVHMSELPTVDFSKPKEYSFKVQRPL